MKNLEGSFQAFDEKNSMKSGGAGSQRTGSKHQTDVTKSNKAKVRHPKHSLVTLFDYTRMEKLFKIINSINQAKSVSETLIPILQSAQEVVNSSHTSFFVFAKSIFSDKDKRMLTIQKTIVESKYIDVVCLVDSEVQSPSFATMSDARNQIYTKKNMCHPIIDSSG